VTSSFQETLDARMAGEKRWAEGSLDSSARAPPALRQAAQQQAACDGAWVACWIRALVVADVAMFTALDVGAGPSSPAVLLVVVEGEAPAGADPAAELQA
jgi:hypothetical protein